MSDLYKDPAKEPHGRELEKRINDHQDWGGSRMNPVGPAGTTVHINQDERGILQDGLFEAMAMRQDSPLGDEHSMYRQGIYGESNS